MTTNRQVATILPWKKYLTETCPHGLAIVLVDGTYVRNRYDSDFCQGGNGFRYEFIPRNEIWIDVGIPEPERPFIVLHECEETELMRKGWSYSRAHDRAKMMENHFRRLPTGDPDMSRKTRKRRPAKLTPRERKLASRFIPQEYHTKKYKRTQTIAIGISRARRQAAKERIDAIVDKYLKG